MNNFTQRALTGTVFVAAIVFLTLFHQYTFYALLFLIHFGCTHEFLKITLKKNFQYKLIIINIAFIVAILLGFQFEVIFILPLIFSFLAIDHIFRKNNNWTDLAYVSASILYVSFPLLLMNKMTTFETEFNPFWALNLFVLIWCSDTFAYLVGKLFGKTPLFPIISPKKTREGFFGALILTSVGAYFLGFLFDINPINNIVLGFVSVLVGSLGDIVESLLKRQNNIKDSGQILPGHGGFLDRFDALLISLPFTTFIYYIFSIY